MAFNNIYNCVYVERWVYSGSIINGLKIFTRDLIPK